MSKWQRYWVIFISAWAERRLSSDDKLQRQQREFLPGALEITQTPPSPLGRSVGWTLMVLFLVALVWVCIGQVDIVATAEGKIVPSTQVKQIQPLEKGVVRRVLVQEGDSVIAGTPLVELDATLTAADQQRIEQDLLVQRLREERLQQLIEWLAVNDSDLACPLGMVSDTVAPKEKRYIQQQLLAQNCAEYLAQRGAYRNAYLGKKAELEATHATIQKLESILPITEKRTAALKSLFSKGLSSEAEFLELEEKRIEQTQNLLALRAQKQQIDASILEVQQQIELLVAQKQSQALEQLTDAQRLIESLTEDLNKAQAMNDIQTLYAPVDGTVQQLAVNTIGGVVEPAQVLMLVVPNNENLIVEAMLENKDIGFVYAGQEAEIKVHTFPFTKYGVIEAKVMNVSSDAIATEQQGLIYKVKLLMDRATLAVDGRTVQLIPGMAVSAEVKTGTRTLVEYVLAPLLRYQQESVRER